MIKRLLAFHTVTVSTVGQHFSQGQDDEVHVTPVLVVIGINMRILFEVVGADSSPKTPTAVTTNTNAVTFI